MNTWLLKRIGTSVLVIWYPLTHLYTYHSITGNTPRFMDGVFGGIEIFLAVILSFYFVSFLCFGRLSAFAIYFYSLFGVFIVVSCSWVILHFLFAGGVRGGALPFYYYLRIIISYLFLFLIGFYSSSQTTRFVWIALFLLISINSIAFINWDRMMIDLRGVLDPAHRGAYLGLSTTALFSGLFAWSLAKRKLSRAALLCLLGVVLFIMGSRANLAGYMVIFPIALAFTISRQTQLVFYTALFFIVMIWLFLMGGWDLLAVSRHSEFFNPGQMTSLIARNEMLTSGMVGIMQNPIFGDYAGQLEIRGTIGSYIHNWLSVWQAFGILPFLSFTLMMLTGIGFGLHVMWFSGRHASRQEQLLAVICLLTAFLVLTSKSVGWAHIALAWGMLAKRALSKDFPIVLNSFPIVRSTNRVAS